MLVKKSRKRCGFIIFCNASPYKTLLRSFDRPKRVSYPFIYFLKYLKILLKDYLRASFCKYRESGDSFKIFNFFIFCPNKAFSELFSKIQGKFENRHFGLPPQLKIDKNDAFSFRSCW